MSTLEVLLSLIGSTLLLVAIFGACELGLMAWRSLTGAPIDPATLPARDRHPSRALPRRWE